MDNAQKLAILPMWVIDRIKEEMRLSPATWQVIIAAVEQAEVPQTLPCEVRLPPGTVIGKGVPVSTLMLAIAQRERYPVHAQSFAEQHQGDPVAVTPEMLRAAQLKSELGTYVTANWAGAYGVLTELYQVMHAASALRADPSEVERLRAENEAFDAGMRNLACQLSAGGYNAESLTADQLLEKVQWGLTHLTEAQARLVAQLQADLTARDEQIDALRQGMKGDYDLDAWLAFVEEAPQLRLDAGRYRWLRSRDLETISQGGVFAGMTPDNLVLNEETLDQAIDAAMAKPTCRHCGDTGQIMVGRSGQAEDGNAPIMEPCEDCDRGMPDLASRPEERGTPETEPCSGCGTPGWTGACNKCVPY